MKNKSLVAVLFVSVSGVAFAQNVQLKNQTLQKVLESMAPKLHNSALSATFVRTNYIPQSLQSFSEKNPLKLNVPQLVKY
jgi:hypothetical protein